MKARREAAILLGLDPARPLSPADALRADLIGTLRLVIDGAGEAVLEGSAVDIARLLSATEALVKLLPGRELPPPAVEGGSDDPRQLLFEMYMQMRERGGIPDEGLDRRDNEIAALPSENAKLRAAARAAGLPVAPTEADIVPPSERAECDPGPMPGPDDPAPPVVIEGKAEPAADDADAFDLRAGFGHVDEPWRRFCTDVEGNPLSVRGRKYWGPVGG
jgi:hypothetical protein